MLNLLDLSPSWNVHVIEDRGPDRRVQVEPAAYPEHCPRCGTPRLSDGSTRPRLIQNGRKHQVFLDLPHHLQRVGLVVNRHRWLCNQCGCSFWEPLPGIHPHFQATARLVAFVGRMGLNHLFAEVAETTGLSERTVRRMCQEEWGRQLAVDGHESLTQTTKFDTDTKV